METPAALQQHEANYKPNAWQEYSFLELGSWVHNLAKRATHRSGDKREKDLTDAQNYLDMMQAKLNSLKVAAGSR